MKERQTLLRPRSGFELGVLAVSGAAIVLIVGALVYAAMSAPSGPPDLRVRVQRAPGSFSGGDAYIVRVENRGGESTENVVVEVRVGSEAREVTLKAVARGDEQEATVVFPRDTGGAPQSRILSYAQTG